MLAESFNYVLAQHITCGVGIPLRPLEQVLHAVRCCFANPFGKLPAVLALDCAQQDPSYRPASAAEVRGV